MKKVLFPKYNKNKCIYEDMAYILDGDMECNNIQRRDFNEI